MREVGVSLVREGSGGGIRGKARRGELQLLLPIGFRWSADGKTEKDPDHRVQQAIQLVFGKMTELGSVRQVLLWFRQENVSLPAYSLDRGEARMAWETPVLSRLSGSLTSTL